jgi:glutathione S-transferase
MVGELGLEYEHNDVAPRAPEVHSPAFLALNPNARVPVIEDDGFVLYESMAINLYLAKKHGKLYPKDAHNEALAWQWSFWETDRLDRQIVNYANHSAVLPQDKRDPALAKAAWDEMVPALDVLEGALKTSMWLAGDAFSVADLNVAAALYRGLTLDLGRWPTVTAWLKKCWERPAAKAARAMRE